MPTLLLDEFANAQIQKVGGHFWGLLERDSLLAPFLRFRFDGHVRDDGEIRVSSHFDFEQGLVRRMVQAREDLASLNCLKVSGEYVTIPVGCLVKSSEVVGDFASELDFYRTRELAGLDF